LPTSPYAFASSLEDLQSAIDGGIGFPCFVKPVMSSSGKGQSRLKSQADVAKAWDKALSSGRVKQPRVIVEGEVLFDFEITQLTVRASDGKGGTATHFCDAIGHVQVDGDYIESWQPQAMSAAAQEKSRDFAAKVTAALGGFGIFGVELFIKGDEVWFSEVSPRPHDTGLVTLVSQYQSEFALHARAILGLPVSTALKSPGASAVIYGGMDGKGIAFEGAERALEVPETELRLFGKPESFVKRRMGVALARGNDTSEARQRAKLAASLMKPISP
jgi:phosphoribosylglycinamide formyltransferase 2